MNQSATSGLVWWTMDYRPGTGRWLRAAFLTNLILVPALWSLVSLQTYMRKLAYANYATNAYNNLTWVNRLDEFMGILFFVYSLALIWSLFLFVVWMVKLNRGLAQLSPERTLSGLIIGIFSFLPFIQMLLIPLMLRHTVNGVGKHLPYPPYRFAPKNLALFSFGFLCSLILLFGSLFTLGVVAPDLLSTLMDPLFDGGPGMFGFLFSSAYLLYGVPLFLVCRQVDLVILAAQEKARIP